MIPRLLLGTGAGFMGEDSTFQLDRISWSADCIGELGLELPSL